MRGHLQFTFQSTFRAHTGCAYLGSSYAEKKSIFSQTGRIDKVIVFAGLERDPERGS